MHFIMFLRVNMSRNCINFCTAFAEFLEVSPLPSHVTSLGTNAQRWVSAAEHMCANWGLPDILSSLGKAFV